METDKAFKLNIVGQAFGASGYASHTRQLALALNKYIDVAVETQKYPGWELNCSQELIDMANKNYQNEVTLMIGIPPFWELVLANNPKKFIGFFIWEAVPLPASWHDILMDERVNQIWTCSTFCERILLDAGIPKEKIFVVPHGYDKNKFYPIQEVKQ